MQLPIILQKYQAHFQPVICFNQTLNCIKWLDFSKVNEDLSLQDFTTTSLFNDYVFKIMLEDSSKIGIGGYNENRIIYQRSEHFGNQEEARSLHLGIDIWTTAGTPVFTPINATVYGFANNNQFGDYGPTIILQHELDGNRFFTLYGHLSLESIENLTIGKAFDAGQKIATLGDFPINGDWPPHLHFQIIEDLEGNVSDYPGVCKPSESQKYLNNCPDPNLILQVLRNQN